MPQSPAAPFILPVNYVSDPASYKAILDGNMAALARLGALYLPMPRPQANMTVLVGPGHIQSGVTLTEVGTYTSGTTTNASNSVTLLGPTTGIAIGNAVIGVPATTISVSGNTHSNTTLDNISTGTTQAWVGATVTGSGIPANTTILSVGASSVTLSAAATTSVTGNVCLIQTVNPIPAGTTVSNISGTTLTLSTTATASTTVALLICQTTGTLVAPISNSRIDRGVIDAVTGVLSIVAGTPGASPTAPAIPAGKMPCFQVLIASTSTFISSGMITDERAPEGLVLNSGGVAFTGGTMNGVTIGATTPAAATFTTMTAASVIETSDSGLKDELHDMEDALAAVLKLRPLLYQFKHLGTAPQAGFIAQEVATLLPDAVVTTPDGIQHIHVMGLVAALVGAVQECHDLILGMQQQINELKAKG